MLCRLREEGVVDAAGVGVDDARIATKPVESCDLGVVLIAGRYTLLDQRAGTELLPRCALPVVSVITAGVFKSGLLATPTAVAGAFKYEAPPTEVIERTRAIAFRVCGARRRASRGRAPVRWRSPAITGILVSARSPSDLARRQLIDEVGSS